MKLKTKNIILFGEPVILSERSARDVFTTAEFIEKYPEDDYAGIITRISIIQSALIINLSTLQWWRILKRFKYRFKFSTRYILAHLSTNQIVDLSNEILEELECVDISKKKVDEEEQKPLSNTYKLLLVRAATGLSINDCRELPITFFNEALEFAFNYGGFKRGESFNPQSYIDKRIELMKIHKMMFPDEWSNN